MSHLSESTICPHCGERYNVQEKQNKAGDRVRRGICPSVGPNPSPTAQIPWNTSWEKAE